MTTPIFRERMALSSIAAKFKADINPLDPAESALSNLEIAWSNDVLRDEVVISSIPHRRALMNFEFGELPQEIGMTLAQLFGVAAVDQITLLTAANLQLSQRIAELEAANAQLVQQRDASIANTIELENTVAALNAVINDFTNASVTAQNSE